MNGCHITLLLWFGLKTDDCHVSLNLVEYFAALDSIAKFSQRTKRSGERFYQSRGYSTMHTDAPMPKTHPKRPENLLMRVSEFQQAKFQFDLLIDKKDAFQ